MKKFTFSIITPTFNRADSGYLHDCIESLQKQKPGNFEYEHLIIDDGSMDKTKEVVEKYAKKDPRVRYFHKENGGSASSWQLGIKKAKNDYVIFLDDDDMLTSDSLKKRANYLAWHKVDWFYGKADWVDENNKRTVSGFQSTYFREHLYERQLISNIVHSGTPTVKLSELRKVVWPEWLKRSQDYFLWLELLRPERGLKCGFLRDKIVLYRLHSGSYTSDLRSSEKNIQMKEQLNQNIRLLHGDSRAFLANDVYMTRKELWGAYNPVNDEDAKLKLELRKILNSRSWKATAPLRKIMSLTGKRNDS